ncbi:FtsW/RodA/SpoVE family cell cycle protein [Pseudaquidulcibacter saccharophilus]|uniref:FtsW/RodA/SpoVE family cell cycle protein n=1 Tax=Pseudaquidulcibacter saccharophilus TaxID=2831900 RepID=UPI001EFEFB1E|nr:putative peptidoglycan glycosyltransferase FtsW [Pseudaquidulcibacter saccharophilus]
MQAIYSFQNNIKKIGWLNVWWQNIDRVTLGLVATLMTIGLILSFGSSPAAAARLDYDNPFFFVYRQAFFVAISFSILISISFLSIDNVRRFSLLLYVISIVLLITILGIGHTAKGAQRWLRFGGFSLQPSEIIKPAAIILVSWVLTRRVYDKGFHAEFVGLAIVAFPIMIFLMQPDVGQTFLLSISYLAIFWVAGISRKWLLGLFGTSIVGVILLFLFKPHFVDRIDKFINPENNDNYQVDRGLDAIASGEIFGRGAGEGIIKHILPDVHTDFIFSLAVEEWGMIGAFFLMSLFAILIIRGIHVASKISDPFAQTSGIGLYLLFGFQVAINLAVNLNLIPAKGMTLPFISYGGSSLIGSAITLGLALAITRKRPYEAVLRK